MNTEVRVRTESWPWGRKFCHCSQTHNFDHTSGALTTELSLLPICSSMVCLGTGHQCSLLDTNWKISSTWYRCVILIYQGTGILSHAFLFVFVTVVYLSYLYIYTYMYFKKNRCRSIVVVFPYDLCTKCMFCWLAFERCVFEEVCRLPVTCMNFFAKLRPLFHRTFSHIVSFNCWVTTEWHPFKNFHLPSVLVVVLLGMLHVH